MHLMCIEKCFTIVRIMPASQLSSKIFCVVFLFFQIGKCKEMFICFPSWISGNVQRYFVLEIRMFVLLS